MSTATVAPTTTSPPSPDEWRSIVAGDPRALVSHGPAWTEAITRTGRFEDATAVIEVDDRRFVLPLVRTGGRPAALATGGSFPSSFGYGGLVGAHLDEGAVAEALRYLASLGLARVSVRPDPRLDHLWAAAAATVAVSGVRIHRVPRHAHVIDLSGGHDDVWANLSAGRRRGIKQARRRGLEVTSASGSALLEQYYRLFERSVERWAGVQHEPLALARWRARRRDPRHKLAALLDTAGEHGRIWLGLLDGDPVAGVIVFQDVNAHYTRGAMDKEAMAKVPANDLVLWSAIEHATARGCRDFHMGESGSSSSLASYKERFGAVGHDYAEYHIERLPLTAADQALRRVAKRAIGFRDH